MKISRFKKGNSHSGQRMRVSLLYNRSFIPAICCCLIHFPCENSLKFDSAKHGMFALWRDRLFVRMFALWQDRLFVRMMRNTNSDNVTGYRNNFYLNVQDTFTMLFHDRPTLK